MIFTSLRIIEVLAHVYNVSLASAGRCVRRKEKRCSYKELSSELPLQYDKISTHLPFLTNTAASASNVNSAKVPQSTHTKQLLSSVSDREQFHSQSSASYSSKSWPDRGSCSMWRDEYKCCIQRWSRYKLEDESQGDGYGPSVINMISEGDLTVMDLTKFTNLDQSGSWKNLVFQE